MNLNKTKSPGTHGRFGFCRYTAAFLYALAIVIFLTGCVQLKPEEPAELSNYIERLDTTPDQQAILDLISIDAEFLFFEYKTEEAFKDIEFWVEVYENGELTGEPSGLHTLSDNPELKAGKVSVMIMKEPGYQWAFSMSDSGGGKISHTSAPLNFDHSGMASGSNYINDPVAIEDGKEIVLYAAQFSSGSTLRAYDVQAYIDFPEYLGSADYLHLIKCKFTK